MNPSARSNLSRFPGYRHRSAGFIVAGFCVATVVSTGLFWITYQLIATVQIVLPPEKPLRGVGFHVIKRTIDEPPKRIPKPKLPPVAQIPMPAKPSNWSEGGGVPGFVFRAPDSGVLFNNSGSQILGIGEREYMPLTEIQPEYPKKL